MGQFFSGKKLMSKHYQYPHLSLDLPLFQYPSFVTACFLVEVHNRESRFYAEFDQMITFMMFHSNFADEIRAGTSAENAALMLAESWGFI